MLPSDRIKPHLRAVQEFGAVLDELTPLLGHVDGPSDIPSRPLNGPENSPTAEVIRRAHRLAGPAADAFAKVSLRMAYTPPPMTGQPTRVVNPAQNWDTIFEPLPMFTVEELRGYVSQVEGALQGRYDQTKRRERGLVGWLARFLLLPQQVREAAGLAKGTAGGRLAFVTGLFVQLLVGLLAGSAAVVIGAWALRLLEWE